ncbi:hypothetical protein B0G80_7368 [Paraburkholderia sp. BL6669N2]|nr:hypothetical protein B0G80_7368 [Paraburkholderia sp. BL6669N2]
MNVKATLLIALALGASNVCLAGGGAGNAHGAATAGPTYGGDNTSTPTSTHKGGFHLKHKKKTPTAVSPAAASQ